MSKGTVLIVDDSLTDFTYAKRIVNAAGFNAQHVDSGEHVVAAAKKIRPICIIMDVVMPNMNGFQATRALSKDEHTASIPVIMLSSKAEQTDRLWAERQGAFDYVTKPAQPRELLTKLKAAVKR